MSQQKTAKELTKEILSEEHFKAVSEEFMAYGSTPMKVAFLYNPDTDKPLPEDPASDPYIQHELEALRALGHTVEVLPVTYDNLHLIRELQADFVFNSCDSTGPDECAGVEVIVGLEKKVVPFSGVGSGPYHLTNDKFAMKGVLEAAKVPAPRGAVVPHPELELPIDMSFPLFVKPRYGYASVAISAKSLVQNAEEYKAAVKNVVDLTGIDALVEEYIPGREITVAVLGGGNRVLVLPPLEVCFGDAYEGGPNIRTEDTKSNANSPLYWDFKTICPAPLDEETTYLVKEVALRAYLAVGCEGYGRIDIRLSPEGIPYVLEVNANPSLEYGHNPQDCGLFTLIGQSLGWNYSQMLARIVGAGMLRPVRHYKAPLSSLSHDAGKIRPRSLAAIRKGALICPVGPLYEVPAEIAKQMENLLPSPDGKQILAEPMIRFAAHADTPNTVLAYSRNRLWLMSNRAIKSGEVLTIDREEFFVAQQPSSQERQVQQRAAAPRRRLARARA